ncbi:MAG: polysaccharide biosynthesis protein [Kyrpidia tusciae]|nr:polysaccharide biosynthesis protein [Kyrpidia tusciae]MBE3551704.1 polysaccharide biosynthesis protein [Kyrpidia tusciae]
MEGLKEKRTAAQHFVHGTLFLSAAVFFCKLLGLIYIVPLQHLIADRGVGIYNAAYPIYNIFLQISTAGLPLAISKFVSEYNAKGDYRTSERLYRALLVMMWFSGLLFAAIQYFGAPAYVRYFAGDNKDVIPAVQAMAPALLVFPVIAIMRGYFQGWQMVEPTGYSQVVEQIVRVVTVLGVAYAMTQWGAPVEQIAAMSTLGAFTGGLAALWWLVGTSRKHRPGVRALLRKSMVSTAVPMGRLLARVVVYAIPISLGALVVPLFNQADVSTVTMSLVHQVGLSQDEAMAQFGILSGRAQKIIAIPATFATTVALTIIPLVSEAYAVRNYAGVQRFAALSLRASILIALPAGVGLALLAGPTNIVLFGNDAGTAAIAILALSTVFSTLESVSSSVLQGMGMTVRPVVNLFIGLVLKVVLNLWWVPLWGIGGAAAASVVSYWVAAELNLYQMKRLTSLRLSPIALWGKPALATAGMVVAVQLWQWVFGGWMGADHSRWVLALELGGAVMIGAGAFAVSAVFLGAVAPKEVESLPRVGPAVARLLRTVGPRGVQR